ncbi:MAG: hypothetical protein ACRD12_16670 [Acidimicrobiales bacterium]
MSEPRLSALLAEQDGMASRKQARGHLTIKQVKGRLANGRIERLRNGIYKSADAPASRWTELRAALLAAGPGALASHRSAAEIWGFPGVMAEQTEIVVPWPQWPRLPGVKTHQSRRLPPGHQAQKHGISVTSPARTVVDLAGVLPAGYLGVVVDHALRQRLATLPEIEEAVALLTNRGRRGLVAMRAVLAKRGPGYQPGDSHGEQRLSDALVAGGLPRPVAQHQVVAGPTVYLLDLAYPDLRLGIEYDDWHTHGSRSAFDRDRVRGNRLAAAGWTLLHVTSAMPEGQAVDVVRAAHRRLTRERGTSKGQWRGVNGG